MSENIIKRIESGPAVLLLGQKYLSLETGTDMFLRAIKEKYDGNSNKIENYKSLPSLDLAKESPAVLGWMYKLSKSISTPEWLKSIVNIPWSSIYTTSYDTILNRAFENEWRNIQPIADDSFRVIDSRDKINLHITYLYGNIEEQEQSKRPPLSVMESFRRKTVVNNLLERLPEIITPKGVLIIDGYDLRDQLAIEDLATVLYSLGEGQTLLCNSESLEENEIIKDLINSKRLIAERKGFALLLSDWLFEDKIKISNPGEFDYFGKWITLQDRRINVPQDILSVISKSGTILDDEIFDGAINIENKAEGFRRFLASSNAAPAWFGYPYGFAFERDYYIKLKQATLSKLRESEFKDSPIILHGQSSSGKTTSLGLLAYQLRTELNYPVLYIEKRYQRVDEKEIEIFCKWIEDNGGKLTFIIWDGMQEQDSYNSLLKKLDTRGRKFVLIGTSYTTNKLAGEKSDPNIIESPIDLTESEKKRFETYLRKFEPIISNILSGINDTNFLAMMYRYIPSVKTNIHRGLVSEYDFFSDLLANKKIGTTQQRGQLYDAFKAAGIEIEPELLDLNNVTEIGTEKLTLADQLIFSIMVPGKFGLNVPFEVLLRIIGFDAFSTSLFKELNEVNIIEWYEYSQGEFQLGPRTSVEASIFSDYLGSRETEVAMIKLLLKNVRPNSSRLVGESDYQIQFAVDLLNKIGPKSEHRYYDVFLYDIATQLRQLREEYGIFHPRLVLKEAYFLREIATKNIPGNPTPLALLDSAEEIVRNALEILEQYPERSIKLFLKVELASILGTKATEYAKNGSFKLAKNAYENIRELISDTYAINPENYGALDVIGWATIGLINFEVFSDAERFEYESDLAYLIEHAEIEGINEQNAEDFNKLKLRFFELVKNQQVADDTFEKLKASGSASGYYIRAKIVLGFNTDDNSEYLKKSRLAFYYLNENYDQIKSDYKCLFLLFRCWWTTKTESVFFGEEKQSLPLTNDDWNYCLSILNRLIAIETSFSTTVYYIKAIAEFHLELFPESFQSFHYLGTETNYSFYGRRRIKKFYMASNPDGSLKVYSGQIESDISTANNEKRGDLYVPDLHRKIAFLLYDFRKSSYQKGERIRALNIAFNFRGPIAVESKNNV